jgi:DNA-binding GntR family transcriptional regulator
VPSSVQTLSDQIHDELRDRLVSHDIPPGDPIRQDVIAAEFGMSKIPVREALARLEANGLVISTRHKGYLSPPLSLEEADDLFSLRILVEPPTAALASTLADPAQRNEIRSRMKLLERGPQSLNRTALQRLDLLEAILQPACRPTSLNLMRQLFFRAERYIHLAPQSGALDIGAVHALLEAWIAGESARVEALYRARLEARWAEARKNATL